jgi:ubiquinol oxidase
MLMVMVRSSFKFFFSIFLFPSLQKRYGCRAMMLETVAAVPGMVGGMLLHCKSLRKFQTSGGWIKTLLEEAENERMHLMTFMEVAQPKWWERWLVFAVQGFWFNAYFLAYIFNPRFAHRLTGYLEEEAIWSYSHFLQEIDKGHIPNGPAPSIAIDYWRLPKNATIRDVVLVVRAYEAHHRDVNHFAAVRTPFSYFATHHILFMPLSSLY